MDVFVKVVDAELVAENPLVVVHLDSAYLIAQERNLLICSLQAFKEAEERLARDSAATHKRG